MSSHLGSIAWDRLLHQSLELGLDYEFWQADREDSKKILIVLHGRGDSREGFHWLPEALAISNFHYLFLNAPDPYGAGFSWYGLAPHQGPGVLRSRKLLFDLLDCLQSQLGVRSQDIYVFGFSQGSLLALDLGLRYPKILGGLVGLSGSLFFDNEYPKALSPCAHMQKFFMGHGQRDSVIPIADTRERLERIRQMGVNINWQEFSIDHSIDEVGEIAEVRDFFEHLLNLN